MKEALSAAQIQNPPLQREVGREGRREGGE